MITHPDYVKKRINKKQTPAKPEKVRYVYPLPHGVKKVCSVGIGMPVNGEQTLFEFVFDFWPSEQTAEEKKNATPKCCSTCINEGTHDCPYYRKKIKAAVCPEWEIYPVSGWGEVLYYANLHKAAYEEKFKAAAGVK